MKFQDMGLNLQDFGKFKHWDNWRGKEGDALSKGIRNLTHIQITSQETTQDVKGKSYSPV